MQKHILLSKITLLAFLLAPAGALAASTATGLDTPVNPTTGQAPDQIFAVGGHQVGDWNASQLNITGSLVASGGISTPSNISSSSTISGVTVTASGAVSGASVSASGAVSGNTVTASNSMTSAAYYHSSDMRLKSAIHPIDDSLDKLLQIRGVEFNWKSDGRPDMGIVAQNVADVFPNVVKKDDKGIMSVEYDSLVGPMIESIRTLKAENDDMKAQLKEMRASIEELKQQNTRLNAARVDRDQAVAPAASEAP